MSNLHLGRIRWINPYEDNGFDRVADLSLIDGILTENADVTACQTRINSEELWLIPALVDTCQHLAAPASSPQSSIEHELEAAWNNGFRRICAAPDTQPCIDNPSVIEWIEQRAQARAGRADLQLLGALSLGLQAQQLSNMASLIKAGCIGLSQADTALPEPALLRQALCYAADLDIKVHLQPQLREQFPGCAHDGTQASVLGLAGIPTVSESLAVAMIVELVRDTGCAVHLSKLSSAVGVQHLRAAQQQGLPLTGDVAIHNLLFTDSAIHTYDTRCHLNPPLRSEQDRQALIEGLADGTLAAICSDHRPLGFDDKFGPFADTQAGANGVDGFLAACLSLKEKLAPLQIVRSVSAGAESVLGMPQDKHSTDDWILLHPTATGTNQQSRHSQSQHSLLLQQQYAGQVVGRITTGNWHISSHWQQELGV